MKAAAIDPLHEGLPCSRSVGALRHYFANHEQRGSKGVPADRYAAYARIMPDLGALEVAKLTSARIKVWQQVKAHREVDVPLVRFLSDEECRLLVAAADGRFRDLVCGALVAGARYGELGRMKVADFNPASGFVTVRLSKAGKSRHIALNDEGQRLFATLTKDCGSQSLIFARGDDKAWKASEQQRPLRKLPAWPASIHQRTSTPFDTPTLQCSR